MGPRTAGMVAAGLTTLIALAPAARADSARCVLLASTATPITSSSHPKATAGDLQYLVVTVPTLRCASSTPAGAASGAGSSASGSSSGNVGGTGASAGVRGSDLPFTGFDLTDWFSAGVVLLAVGFVVLRLGRRRPQQASLAHLH